MGSELRARDGQDTPLERTLTASLDRARGYLEQAQHADGRWLDFRDRRNISSCWVTAYIGTQLAHAAPDADAAVDKATAWLLAHPHPEGGWGYNRATRPDADTIANVIHLLTRHTATEDTARALGQAVELLGRFFVPETNGFRTYHPVDGDRLRRPDSSWCSVHPCVTAMCALALANTSRDTHVQASADHLRDRQREDGLFDAFWWDGTAYATYHAARVLHLVGYTDEVTRAKHGLLAEVQDDGGWGARQDDESSAFHTALAARTLCIASDDEHRRALAAALSWLVSAQQPDGGWASVPMLRVPRPDVHISTNAPDEHWVPTLRDRNRLFTTATVLSALFDGRSVVFGPNA